MTSTAPRTAPAGVVLPALGLTALTLALHLPALIFRLFNSDEASLATVAMALSKGDRLYHQTADRKPPIVPLIYEGVFRLTGSHDLRPVRVVAVLALTATALVLAVEGRDRFGATWGWLTGAVFAVAVVTLFPSDTQAAGYELFMLLPAEAAFVAARRGQLVAAGVLLAAAGLCKQPALTEILPLGYLAWRHRRGRGVAVVAGTAAVVLVATASAFGLKDFVLWVVTGNGGYVSLRGSGLDTFLRGFGMTWAFIGINLALVLLVITAAVRRTGDVALWLWLASSAAAVAVGARFFGHYFLQLYPPMAVLAASALRTMRARPRVIASLALAGAALVMVGVGALPQDERGLLPYAQMASAVRRYSAPNERIFVWGEFPEIYWASGRQPATRFVHTGFITGHSGGRPAQGATPSEGLPGAYALLEQDFAAHPPALIVDTTGANIRSSRYYPLDTTRFWTTERAHYQPVATVQGAVFYRRVEG